MKAIIPVAGIGTRLRPHTHTQPKALIPIAGKPILAHITESLIDAGILDFVFVIGYLGDKIEHYILTHYPNINAQFVIQTTGKGVGHAIWLARECVKPEEEILIVFGDTIVDADLKEICAKEGNWLGIKKVEDPRLFGVAEVDSSGTIIRVIEKPAIPKSNMALVGVFKIKDSAKLLEELDTNLAKKLKTHGEFTLTDAISQMINLGFTFHSFGVDNWFDCGKKEILLETNSLLLKRLNYDTSQYHFDNTIIIPPVFIGEGCKISNSIIGPNVSVGEHAILNYATLNDSIIGPYAQIEYAILHRSLIGNDAFLKGMSQSLNIGDSTEINFG
ncbi:MAG: NTP transferase domain-containing protein [Bacteroidia bacterium]|nr:NTP transferase domain-containing protein [Bacteroidia bacterium]MCF8448087.1 NTP transferase domain-containing protein [Bacteroidia bacterium]